MTWLDFAGVFGLFFLTHSIPVRPSIKSRIIALIGPKGFGMGYSALSLAMLALLIWSAGQAPYIELWPQMVWQRHAVHIGMLAVCLILAFTIAHPNPFSFGGSKNESFDPQNPGIVRLIRHPMLLALSLWAGLHMLPNGDLAHVLLFGVLGGFAFGGRILINRRMQHEMGLENWNNLNTSVTDQPLIKAPVSWRSFVLRLASGIVLFVVLLALHPLVIGISAL
jgi:uncharacterized membrane protein